ncbi:DUF3570 domain-containing protein [Tenacibaculum finnmarkense]|uniref:DUF3570 domain-containing protein n=1 Tax=Tenacibaculum finnmarkense TaxID=2781243 RepID=UPI001E4B684F|nr:DUF3570 domain-containing protein [Tenacibaculum finnmarkense]MCD8444006.1 DUF3570 domain-containing protein [Tenacibaculum finnmarkense genomovar ulcerans]
MTKINKKLTFALVLSACIGFAQNTSTVNQQEDKNIKVSLLGNYYGQDGERGAPNGGIGSQELHSYTREAKIFVPVSKIIDAKFNAGVDYFTSASYLLIDKYQTSASSGNSGVSVDETRKYGDVSIDLSINDFKITPLFGYSEEYDVKSKTFGLSGSYKNPKNLSTFTFKSNLIMDKWLLIYPGEFRPTATIDAQTGASDKGTKIGVNADVIQLTDGEQVTKDGNTYNVDDRLTSALGVNYAFNINKRMNALVGVDGIYQSGLLSTPFYRVYFRDGIQDEYAKTVAVEKLPNERLKLAIYGRYNYFVNKLLIVRTSARLYADNWGVNSLTLGVDAPIKIKPWVSVMPFYKFHTQTAADHFAGYGQHELSTEYYTSDFDLSNLYSNKFGASARIVPFKQFLGIKSIDVRYTKYLRSDGLSANSVSVGASFEFSNFLKKKNK